MKKLLSLLLALSMMLSLLGGVAVAEAAAPGGAVCIACEAGDFPA